jgi:hypothetical protein
LGSRTGEASGDGYGAEFQRNDGESVRFRLMPVPVGVPKARPRRPGGPAADLRAPSSALPCALILCSESGGCMRLESGAWRAWNWWRRWCPWPNESEEMEAARLLGGGHDTTNPLNGRRRAPGCQAAGPVTGKPARAGA